MKVLIGHKSGVRHTVVLPDEESQVPGLVAWLEGMGESVLVGDVADYRELGPDVMLERHLGKSGG